MNCRTTFEQKQIQMIHYIQHHLTTNFNFPIIMNIDQFNEEVEDLLDLQNKGKSDSNHSGHYKSKSKTRFSNFNNFKFYKNTLQKVTGLFFERQFLVEKGWQVSDLPISLLNPSKNALFLLKHTNLL